MKFIITEEQNEKLNQKVRFMVNKYGINHTLTMFDDKDIIKRAYQDNPSEFLNQFNNLTAVEEEDYGLHYMDKDGLVLFIRYPYEENRLVYINHYRIWLFFSDVIGLEYSEIQDIIKKWLKETYNLRRLTPVSSII